MTKDKKQKNRAAQQLARRRHKVHPNSPEFYKKLAKLGAEARWGKKEDSS